MLEPKLTCLWLFFQFIFVIIKPNVHNCIFVDPAMRWGASVGDILMPPNNSSSFIKYCPLDWKISSIVFSSTSSSSSSSSSSNYYSSKSRSTSPTSALSTWLWIPGKKSWKTWFGKRVMLISVLVRLLTQVCLWSYAQQYLIHSKPPVPLPNQTLSSRFLHFPCSSS